MESYVYEGPVKDISKRIINPKWYGQTKAISKEKALNNLSFQYKKQNKKSREFKVFLDSHFIYKEEY